MGHVNFLPFVYLCFQQIFRSRTERCSGVQQTNKILTWRAIAYGLYAIKFEKAQFSNHISKFNNEDCLENHLDDNAEICKIFYRRLD